MSTQSALRGLAVIGVAICQLFAGIAAQQFQGYTYPWDSIGLSQSCLSAVNTTLTLCPWKLASSTTADSSVDLLDEDDLDAICTAGCANALGSLRSAIISACTADQDVMVYNNIAYPATFMVDKLQFTYDASCYKDQSSGSYCDLILAQWRNETNITTTEQAANNCSDCMLGPWKLQLSSPLGYSDSFAEAFSSVTSSCGATGYAFTSPTAYALNSSTTAATATATSSSEPTATATCVGTYTVQANDTCNSIAAAQGVSTYNLMTANNINVFCSNLVEGSSLCIPQLCTSKPLLLEDTCSSIMAAYNISKAQLLAWNPMLEPSCTRLIPWLEWQICTGPPGGYQDAVSGTAASAAPAPTNAMTDSNQDCGQWATVAAGDTCASLSVAYGISLDDFYFLNPETSADCTNLWLGYAYCVQAVGTITTYPGYSVTVPSTSFTRPATTTTSYTVGASTVLPVAPGSVTGCAVSRDYYNSSTLDVFGRSYGVSDVDFNDCSNVAGTYGVTVEQLVTWNPSLDASACELKAGYSYCVILSYDEQSTGVAAGSTECEAVNSTQIVPGTVSDCSCYILLVGSEAGDVNCLSIEEDFSLTETQLLAYNPWANSAAGCDSGIYDGLGDDDFRALCVAVGSTSSVQSSTTTPTPTSTVPTSTAASSASPSITPMPDITDKCTKYHVVVQGDGCWAIANEYGISLDDFYAWNPDVGTDCSSLWLGYGVCVSIS